DVGVRRRPLHAGDDPGVLAPTAVAEHLADHQFGPRSDAPVAPVGGSAGAGDRRGNVGAMAVQVLHLLAGDEALRLRNLSLEVGMAGVVAGVEDRDRRAIAVDPDVPGFLDSDLLAALVETGVGAPVQPDL